MLDSEKREIIAQNLDNVLESTYIPELGEPKKGKVREIYFTKDFKVIMIASDRVSAFDDVLSRCIPFKGAVLTGISSHAMEIAKEIMPTAMQDAPHPNVIVQEDKQNIGVECIVRGFVWGSFAKKYEAGHRNICGIELPDGLLRYQTFNSTEFEGPLFTPTTKAPKGEHDEDITFKDMVSKFGAPRANKIKECSLALFNKFYEYCRIRGMFLLDTKYEFGVKHGTLSDWEGSPLVLIDEATTPDSSRFCSAKEWNEKFQRIAEEMKSGKYETVSQLLEEKPELKIKEESKQFVRDVLIEAGYEKGQPVPELTDEQVIEASLRYVKVYETFTGKEFDFNSALNARQAIVDDLAEAGYIKGSCIALMLASEKDQSHAEKLMAAAEKHGVACLAPFYASAHKETGKVLEHLGKLDKSLEPIVIIASAGRSNGLGPVIAGNSRFPVIACNPYKDMATYQVDIHSSTRMPSNLPLGVVVDPGNAVLYAKKILDLKK